MDTLVARVLYIYVLISYIRTVYDVESDPPLFWCTVVAGASVKRRSRGRPKAVDRSVRFSCDIAVATPCLASGAPLSLCLFLPLFFPLSNVPS